MAQVNGIGGLVSTVRTRHAPQSAENVAGPTVLWREGEPFSQRFRATLSHNGNTITGRWEIAEDSTNYTTGFDLTYTRVE